MSHRDHKSSLRCFNRQISGVHAEQRKDETSELSMRQRAVVKEPIMRSRGQPEKTKITLHAYFPSCYTRKSNISLKATERGISKCHKQLHNINKHVRRKTHRLHFGVISRLTELKIWPSIFFVVFCPVTNPPNNHTSEEGWVWFYRGYYTNLRPTILSCCPWVLPLCSLSAQQVCRSRSASIFSTFISVQHYVFHISRTC